MVGEIEILDVRSKSVRETDMTALATNAVITCGTLFTKQRKLNFYSNYMNKKALIIPVAAMAVMATNAYAFSSDILEQAGLSDDQIAAFEAAYELREEGDREAARETLEEAGIDHETMHSIRDAAKEARREHREAVRAAVEAEDYEAFLEAVGDSPMAEEVISEEDFAKLVEAHVLRETGDHEGERALMEELGIEHKGLGRGGHGGHGFGHDHNEAEHFGEMRRGEKDDK